MLPSNKELLLSRKNWFGRCAGAQAGRAAEFQTVMWSWLSDADGRVRRSNRSVS